MAAIITEKFRLHNAKQFFESFNETGDNTSSSLDSTYYFFIGKSSSFIDADNYGVENSVSDNVPPVPHDDVASESYTWDSMIAAKRITSSDVTFAIPRRNWTNDTTYDMYEHDIRPAAGVDTVGNLTSTGVDSLWFSNYYFITSEYKVYKILENTGTNSDFKYLGTEPTSTSYLPFFSDGGYLLKYMYTLSVEQIDKFLTSDFIPVTTDSDVSAQAVDGRIHVVRVTGGTGYTNGTYYTSIKGDGNGAVVKLFVSGGTIQPFGSGSTKTEVLDSGTTVLNTTGDGSTLAYTLSSSVTSTDFVQVIVNSLNIDSSQYTINGTSLTFTTAPAVGETIVVTLGNNVGYTYGYIDLTDVYSDSSLTTPANIDQSNTGDGGNVDAVISPRGGHGYDAVAELGGHFVMMNVKMTQSEGDDFTIANDFRQLGIVVDPYNWGTTTAATESTRRQSFAIKFGAAPTTDFIIDEKLTQSVTGAIGKVVDWDSTNNILYYTQERHPNYGIDANNNYVAFSGANLITGAVSNASETPSVTATETITLPGGNDIIFTAGYCSPELEPDSGSIIYFENRRPISRAADQTEDIKITIEFWWINISIILLRLDN